MKKLAILLLCLLLGVSALAVPATAESASLNIVCTTFPQYDWVRAIVGDDAKNVSLTLLLDSGVDLHSYQPTAKDIATISACDLFVYVGGESDGWVNDALAAAQNKNLTALSLLECVEAKEEEVVEGMQAEDDGADADAEEEPEYDEHVWLSLRNAQTLTSAICEALCTLDPDNAEGYRRNAGAYIAQLADLDGQYQAMTDAAARNTVLFASRFPFRYLVDDYKLNYYAAFVGCSAESEASFETVAFLAAKVDELALPAVLVIEGDDHSIANTVISSTADKNQQILTMNSLQSVTARDVAAGTRYLDVMAENLVALRAALN